MTQAASHIRVHFDLRTPCPDCPFRRDVPHHRGVLASLPDYIYSIEAATFSHTCHKTDARSDCESAKHYAGKAQHCAGALIMLYKDNYISAPMADAWQRGELDFSKLDLSAPVYTRSELIQSYMKFARALLEARKFERSQSTEQTA